MDFDFKRTVELIKGGLLNSQENADAYLAESPPWQKTLALLTGPLLLANVLLSAILARIIGGYAAFGMGGGFITMLLRGLVLAALGFLIAVFAFNFLAGVFKGKPDFSKAFAAISLAAIPAWVAGIVGAAIPWVGWLIALAGGIWSLVLLYRIVPPALDVPGDKRVVHFIVSLVAIFLVNLVVSSVLMRGAMAPDMDRTFSERAGGDRAFSTDISSGTGLFGDAQRQAQLVESAQRDRFEAPEDGEVSEDQVEYLLEVAGKAQAAAEERTAKLEKLSEEMKDKETASPGDLLKMYQGMGTAVRLSNVEMEVVKTGGGNWAEYRWVKEQLRVAKLQQGEGSDALEHNYELYEEHREQLDAVL